MGRSKIEFSKKRKKHSLSFDDKNFHKIKNKAKKIKKSVSRFMEDKSLQ